MADYIDRDAAIAACFDGFADCRDDCAANIRSIPSADVRPVVHGKWTLNKDGSGTCSECGRKQYNCWDMDNWDNFCHFCGADMRSVPKEET